MNVRPMELNNECSALWNEALPQGLIPLFAAPERLPAKGRKVHRHQPFSILPEVPQSIFSSPNLCYKKVLLKQCISLIGHAEGSPASGQRMSIAISHSRPPVQKYQIVPL